MSDGAPQDGKAGDATSPKGLTPPTARQIGDWWVTFLFVLGSWLLVAPLLPEHSGYSWLRGILGGEAAVLRWFLAFGFLVLAALAGELLRQRRTLEGFMKIIRAQLSGRDEDKEAQAIEILVRAMQSEKPSVRESALRGLKQLTGQDFGEDGRAWAAWWAEARAARRR